MRMDKLKFGKHIAAGTKPKQKGLEKDRLSPTGKLYDRRFSVDDGAYLSTRRKGGGGLSPNSERTLPGEIPSRRHSFGTSTSKELGIKKPGSSSKKSSGDKGQEIKPILKAGNVGYTLCSDKTDESIPQRQCDSPKGEFKICYRLPDAEVKTVRKTVSFHENVDISVCRRRPRRRYSSPLGFGSELTFRDALEDILIEGT